MKICNTCELEKPESEFCKDYRSKDGIYCVCKSCKRNYDAARHNKNREKDNKRNKLWYEKNREKILIASHQQYQKKLGKRYGFSDEQIQELLGQQDGKCKICQKPFGLKTPHLDHNHETGSFRGFLCGKCNAGIGLLGDSCELCLKAAEYLRNAL